MTETALMDRVDRQVRAIHDGLPHRVNPYTEAARSHLAEWVERTGLVLRDSARRRFERADFGWFAALVYPSADQQQLELMADWFAWLFLVDDQLDDGSAGRSPGRLQAMLTGMRAVLESPDLGRSAARRTDLPTAVSSLADLWARTASTGSALWRRRFIGHLESCLRTAVVWEAGNRISGTVPDIDTYITNRRHTGAIYVCMDLIAIAVRLDVPEPLYQERWFAEALDASSNIVCWTNDVYSLEKERALGEVHNLVHVVEYHRQLDREAALTEVCTMLTAELARFHTAERELLRAYPSPADRTVLVPSLDGMRSWMRGNVDWSSSTKRYQDAWTADGARPAGYPPEAYRPEEYLESGLLGSDR